MNARVRLFLNALSETFWLVPAAMILVSVIGAVGMLALDRSGLVPTSLLGTVWLYNGGATGARTLLGSIVSSTINVAGTVFSITIAALTLAAGQMGPRLLRNFTRDRGNQITLGVFLGTFSYAMMVLRSVRTEAEGEFVPHVALTVAIVLAFVSVGTLVYFVHHMSGRINVDEVIELVNDDLRQAIDRLPRDEPVYEIPDGSMWRDATPVIDRRRGYLRQIDEGVLADWAQKNDTAVRMLVGLGDYVFPGAPIALLTRPVEGFQDAVADATALGKQRGSSGDFEFAVRQLVEVAVRALSPGINDPHTAISVIDRLGAALCELEPLRLPSGVHCRDGRPVLHVPSFDYDRLVNRMFLMIRQNAAGSPAVLVRLLDVLTSVVSCEKDPGRRECLQHHADLVLADAERTVATPSDLRDIAKRRRAFDIVRDGGLAAMIASAH